MAHSCHGPAFRDFSLPQWRMQRAGLPTPPEEEPPSTHAMLVDPVTVHTVAAVKTIEAPRMEMPQACAGACCDDTSASRNYHKRKYQETTGPLDPYQQGFHDERKMFRRRVANSEMPVEGSTPAVQFAQRSADMGNDVDLERRLWVAHVKELRMENQHMQHTMHLNALKEASTSPHSDANALERSEARSLRHQLACMNERCKSLTDKMARLQEQTAEAHRLLTRERQERLEERNNQLTVVVAKHGLERRMRNREQDLQVEWRRNAELEERCRKLEEDLMEAREASKSSGRAMELPLRGERQQQQASTLEWPNDDKWSDKTAHLPPEFGYSKYVRWRKRARKSYDQDVGSGKKQRKASPETRRLQLAGSESPPYFLPTTEQTMPGASAIDQMISGEFTESETPSRATTPPAG